VAVLFSGGLDSAVIAVLAHLCIDQDDSIDLINVAFPCPEINSTGKKIIKMSEIEPNFSTPDRNTGRATYSELVTLFPERNWNFIEVVISARLGHLLTFNFYRLISP
jgi:asparagine synthetase B (glutamine-hydrolysing)